LARREPLCCGIHGGDGSQPKPHEGGKGTKCSAMIRFSCEGLMLLNLDSGTSCRIFNNCGSFPMIVAYECCRTNKTNKTGEYTCLTVDTVGVEKVLHIFYDIYKNFMGRV
jgi:hypothetical protein